MGRVMMYADLIGNCKMLRIKSHSDNNVGNWELELLTDWAFLPSKTVHL